MCLTVFYCGLLVTQKTFFCKMIFFRTVKTLAQVTLIYLSLYEIGPTNIIYIT